MTKPKWQERDRGERFKARFHESKSKGTAHRLALLIAGILITIVGICLVPLPGPGWLIVIFGMGLISGEVLLAARLMDTLDKRMLEKMLDFWKAHRVLSVLVLIAFVCACGLMMYKYAPSVNSDSFKNIKELV